MSDTEPIVEREFWVIQERFGFVPTAWRDVGNHKQSPGKRFDKDHAIRTINDLRNRITGSLEYRIVRRIRKDFETDL